MSGGSFDYLCFKDLGDLCYSGFGAHWDDMLAELDMKCPEAAAEMRKIRTSTEEFMKEHWNRWTKLQPLLHDIEWWRSSDYGEDQVDKAVAKYKGTGEDK